ncbi:MAG: hypothetical protein IPH99_09290 [Xanthomonadales bacterium]|nr:hypothetical protein [Xanthomonadales bacterium]
MNAQFERKRFCELDAVRLYCQFVNELDVEPFLEKLAPDVLYTSHWVLEDLNTNDAVANLLRGKVENMRRSSTRMHEALIGVATSGWQYGKPIVIVTKPGSKTHEATVDFKIQDGLISTVAFISPGMQKAALLTDPDNYVYEDPEKAQSQPATPIPRTPEPPDLDPADIIATFADVEEVLYAPLTDEVIGQCPKRMMGDLEVKLVPFGYAQIQDIDHPGLASVLEAARMREVYLFALSYPATKGLIGVMTFPRAQVPWASIKMTSEEWYLEGEKTPNMVGIDFDAACELRFLHAGPMIRRLATVVARPRPSMAIADLESRYLAIQSAASEPLEIDGESVSTWSRFLLRGFASARQVARNGVMDRLVVGSSERHLAELALEAWPTRK